MKTCNNCGTQLPDSAAVCSNCDNTLPRITKEPVSIGGWIGRSLIPCIPLVGGLVYLIMLFIWSGDTKKEDTFRNWAKAQLIVMAVVVVLTIIVAVVFGAALSEIANSMY